MCISCIFWTLWCNRKVYLKLMISFGYTLIEAYYNCAISKFHFLNKSLIR